MLVLLLTSLVASADITSNFKNTQMYFGTLDPAQYHSANFNFEEKTSLMMVEWDDAVLSITTETLGNKPVLLTKHSGVSFFTFSTSAKVHLEFSSSKVSYYVVPFAETSSTGVTSHNQQFSNLEKIEVQVQDPNLYGDIFISAFGQYKVKGQLYINSNQCSDQIYFQYHTENDQSLQINNNIGSVEVSNAVGISSFKMGKCPREGSILIQCSQSFTPTVPTSVNINYPASQKNFDGDKAHGGINDNKKAISISDLKKYQYILIKNIINYDKKYTLTIETKDGSKILPKDEMFGESHEEEFTADIYISSANCEKTFIETVKSGVVEITGTHEPYYVKVSEVKIPDKCIVSDKGKGGVGTGGIIAIVIVVIVVIAIVVVVVVIIIRKKRKNAHSSQEGNTTNIGEA